MALRADSGEPILRSDRAPSSATLMRQIDECLVEAGLRPDELAGLVALRGPGSFTGLRVGLSTVLGLRAALGVPATTFTNLEVLAAAAGRPQARILAVADALRGEWMVQLFAPGWPPAPLGEATLLSAAEIALMEPDLVTGFDLETLGSQPGWASAIETLEAGPLAPAALQLAAARDLWDPSGLTAPVYARPPVAPSARRR